ncbi:FecR domain-containing protein [uncultured Chitinophaga sp.]|uniref:FecR domain-containing protein n=1 Tax=uncultured Chitinophaga sp. TaxID=339340 RepID=UPI0025E24611|nr:FecR domain-containing protein [uncultured Chitinophaga sp.]
MEKYASDSLSEPERLLLQQYTNDPEQRADVEAVLEESYLSGEYTTAEPPERAARLHQMLQARMHPATETPVRRIRTKRIYWAAASVLLLMAAGIYYWSARTTENLTPSIATKGTDIQPGKNGAILTLADGSEIVLDSLKNGLVAQQTGTQVMLSNGQLQYNASGQPNGEMQYNTISTPKGRQFRVTLPDGTIVWLNAASSIRYPTFFAGKDRRVQVNGEVYFEVAQNAQQPFRVSVNNKEEIDVLGTHFNVNAYENEQHIETTLLQGSIRVSTVAAYSSKGVTLKPGQQSQITPGGGQPDILVSDAVDTDKVMAWKNGAFNFDNLSLDEAMRVLERWYDIEVVYENGIPDIQFGGEIDRNVSLSELLKILGKTKLKFRIEENRKLVIIK